LRYPVTPCSYEATVSMDKSQNACWAFDRLAIVR
jgi:hypothetical protein